MGDSATMAERYTDTDPHCRAPHGALVQAEVVVFEDSSVHVGGPAIVSFSEAYLVAAFKTGLEMLGYDVKLTRNPNGAGNGVEVTGIKDPIASTFVCVAES